MGIHRTSPNFGQQMGSVCLQQRLGLTRLRGIGCPISTLDRGDEIRGCRFTVIYDSRGNHSHADRIALCVALSDEAPDAIKTVCGIESGATASVGQLVNVAICLVAVLGNPHLFQQTLGLRDIQLGDEMSHVTVTGVAKGIG